MRSDGPVRYVFWAAVWLAIALVAIKAYFLGAMIRVEGQLHLRSLAAISYRDVAFVSGLWACARLLILAVRRWHTASAAASFAFVALAAFFCLYAVADVVVFGIFGGFVTYPLLALVGDIRMLSSSVAAYLTPRVAVGMVGVPLLFVALVWMSVRMGRDRTWSPAFPLRFAWAGQVAGPLLALAWIAYGYQAYEASWRTRQERAIAENPQWVFVSSWWRAFIGGGTIHMNEPFDPADLADFEPIGSTGSGGGDARRLVAPKPGEGGPNVVLIVLESVAARWTNLHGGIYETTPSLAAAAGRGLAADNFYAHIGRSSSSLVSLLLGIYPKLDFREITDEYPRLPGTSLASLFQSRGYRTAFFTPSDLNWAGWGAFLQGRGFAEINDYHQLPCTALISSWGVEDRCMVDGILGFIAQEPSRPFFVMGWTTQTHHPYEPTPGVPLLGLLRERLFDEYDLNRYLNVIRETDRHLGRLFDSLRQSGRDQDTLVVVVGDHGQGFGYPHEGNYTQGRTVHEEDVHVPLLIWYPRMYPSGARTKAIAGHVDLPPTIADLAGMPMAPEWQGRSLFDPKRPPRTYFYVAEDRFKLGVREHNWKYILDLREAVDELYDLERDPDEQHNIAAEQPALAARLRRRLAAWTDANHRQYEGMDRR